jgi:L-threonylcarbamoyladenylate synthase
MEIIKVSPEAPSPFALNKIVRILKNGGVIAFPTDTAYGLGAAYLNKKAIKKVFKIKKRPLRKNLGLIAADLKQVKNLFFLNKKEINLAIKHWPGPLTIVLKSKKGKREAIRVPNLKLARAICRKLSKPITATSANKTGKKECYSLTDFQKQLRDEKNWPDIFIDAGKLKKIKSSTIVKILNNKIIILRKGPVEL